MTGRTWGTVLALVMLTVTAACGQAPSAGNSPQPPVWVEPACSESSVDPMRIMSAARGGIPDDFVPTAVLRCRLEERGSAGQGTVGMVITERADADAGLLAELRRPSDPRSNGVCAASYVMPPYFLLVDAGDRALLPAVPTDGCGQPRQQVRDLVESLPYRPVAEARFAREPGSVPVERLCANPWKDTAAFDPGQARPGPAHRVWPEPAGDLQVCVYDRISGAVPVGQLDTASLVTGDAATALRAALDAAGPAAACPTGHSRFAVITPSGKESWATVELDGCLRVRRPDSTLGQLDAAAVALIAAR